MVKKLFALYMVGILSLVSCPNQEIDAQRNTIPVVVDSFAEVVDGIGVEPIDALMGEPSDATEDERAEYEINVLHKAICISPHEVNARLEEIRSMSIDELPPCDSGDPWNEAVNSYLESIGIENPSYEMFRGFDLLEFNTIGTTNEKTEHAVIYEQFCGDALLFRKNTGEEWYLIDMASIPSGCYGTEVEIEQFVLDGKELVLLSVLYDSNCGTSSEFTRVLIDLPSFKTVFSFVESQLYSSGGSSSHITSTVKWDSAPTKLVLSIDYTYVETLQMPEHILSEDELAALSEEEFDEFDVAMNANRHVEFYYDNTANEFVLDEEMSDALSPCMWQYTEDSTYTPFYSPLSADLQKFFEPELQKMKTLQSYEKNFAEFLLSSGDGD